MGGLGNRVPPDVEQRPEDSGALRDANFTRYVLPEVETLLRVAMTLTAQPADAEDLVQDTLMRAYQAAHRFHLRDAARGYQVKTADAALRCHCQQRLSAGQRRRLT
jgi:DNA-directed RNA polymerase specialized sigma24 family protein